MHPDRRVALALQRIDATADAEAAAAQLFETWDDLALFFSRVFEDRETNIGADLAVGRLEETYRLEDLGLSCPVQPGRLLHHLGKNGISAAKDAAYVAEFCRAFLADPAMFQGHGDDEYVIAFETVSDFEPEQLVVFEDYDIHTSSHREHVRKCVVVYHIPVEYVRGLWLGLAGLYAPVSADAVYELHTGGVPIGYARTAALAYAYFAMLRRCSGRISELASVASHVLTLYRAGIPESYVDSLSLRSAADIIALYEAGVPDGDAKAFRFSTDVSVIIEGHRCGIPHDYMMEVAA